LKFFASGAEALSFYHPRSIPVVSTFAWVGSWCRHLLELATQFPGIATRRLRNNRFPFLQ